MRISHFFPSRLLLQQRSFAGKSLKEYIFVAVSVASMLQWKVKAHDLDSRLFGVQVRSYLKAPLVIDRKVIILLLNVFYDFFAFKENFQPNSLF